MHEKSYEILISPVKRNERTAFSDLPNSSTNLVEAEQSGSDATSYNGTFLVIFVENRKFLCIKSYISSIANVSANRSSGSMDIIFLSATLFVVSILNKKILREIEQFDQG